MPTKKQTAPAPEAETGDQAGVPATPEPAKADDTGTHVEPGTPDTDEGGWEPIIPLTADDIAHMRNERHTGTGAVRWNPTVGLEHRGEPEPEPTS